MLARNAESLYWIGRYVERADDTARILDVTVQRLLEDATVDPDRTSRVLLRVLGIAEPDTELDVWSLWCVRVRPGHRGEGISHALVKGAVEFARDGGAPAIEAYPVDNKGKKVDLTMAYVGTRRLFEKAGFTKAADTDSVLNGFPRVLVRLDLR